MHGNIQKGVRFGAALALALALCATACVLAWRVLVPARRAGAKRSGA